MHFRILKMIATSDFLTAIECTKSIFGRGSAPDLAGGAYSAPQAPSLIKGFLLLREGRGGAGKRGKGEERGGKRREREGKRREGKEKGGKGSGRRGCPQRQLLDPPMLAV